MTDGKSDTTDDVVLAVLARIERKLDECLRYARMTDAERAFDAQYERWKEQHRDNAFIREPQISKFN